MEKLTIDEIIRHCKRKTEQYEQLLGKECLETMPLNSSVIKEYWEHRQVAEYLRKLKDYEDLGEQGRLVELPCKVGDTVYHVVQGRIVEVSNVDLFSYCCRLSRTGLIIRYSSQNPKPKQD